MNMGYINDKAFSDVKSFRVFSEGNKTFAVPCKLIPAVEPEFVLGGFAARCVNQDEVWSGSETTDIGEAFEIEERNGIWGCYSPDVTNWLPFDNLKEAEEFVNTQNAPGYKWVAELDKNNRVGAVAYCYRVTKTGKTRKAFRKLGKIEKTCKYFYDYNF